MTKCTNLLLLCALVLGVLGASGVLGVVGALEGGLLGGLTVDTVNFRPYRVESKASLVHDPAASVGSAEYLARHLSKLLHLSTHQTRQLQQLTLTQAQEEQRLWVYLADTAGQQLHLIALKYDQQMQQVLSPAQYTQFAKLRAAQWQRRRAKRLLEQADRKRIQLP